MRNGSLCFCIQYRFTPCTYKDNSTLFKPYLVEYMCIKRQYFPKHGEQPEQERYPRSLYSIYTLNLLQQ